MTSLSLRERFGLDTKQSATATRYIKEAVDAEEISAVTAKDGRKLTQYVPWWAAPGAHA